MFDCTVKVFHTMITALLGYLDFSIIALMLPMTALLGISIFSMYNTAFQQLFSKISPIFPAFCSYYKNFAGQISPSWCAIVHIPQVDLIN